MSTKKPVNKKPAQKQKPDRKMVRIHAKHDFTPDEIKELGLEAGRQQREIAALEANLSCIKKDYSSKIESAEASRNRCLERVQEGFEMREIEAVCEFEDSKKKKHFFAYDSKKKDGKGALIRSEDFQPADLERDLPFPTGANVKAEQQSLNPVLDEAAAKAAQEAVENGGTIGEPKEGE